MIVAAIALGLLLSPPGEDVVERARRLAAEGRRAEALALLDARLAETDDSDARVLRGTVLSWEKRYDEARGDLERVVADSPGHPDALPALVNVELWSDHPGRALQRVREGLTAVGDAPWMRLLEAKALHAAARDSEALVALDRVLRARPGDADALELRERVLATRRRFELRLSFGTDWFDDDGEPWHETALSLKRETRFGPVLGRYSDARRFGLGDQQLELEAYPRVRPGTYAFVGAGYSPDHELYPEYRAAFDLYQNLARSFELSLGYRRLGFRDPVNIYTGSLGLYRGNWYWTLRTYVTPGAPGTSVSAHLTVRRYFGDGKEYLGLRYGHGRSREELRTLDDLALLGSDTLVGEWNVRVGPRFEVLLRGGWSREERASNERRRRLSAEGAVGYRF